VAVLVSEVAGESASGEEWGEGERGR
jgi:hypothetical protein